MKCFARQMQARVAALGRAHDYVRPHSEESARHEGPSTLKSLLTELLSPYPALDEGRLTIDGHAESHWHAAFTTRPVE